MADNQRLTLAQELSSAGLTVVSGLARGVDSKAHEAALYGAGGTIAVLPTPIDKCYPPENLSLFHKIAEQGLLVSETPIGTPLHPGQFPQRNRIIAALSVGTVVVEGATKKRIAYNGTACIRHVSRIVRDTRSDLIA